MEQVESATQSAPWRKSAIGDKRSVVGALVIVLTVALFVVVVPFVNGRVEQRGGLDEAGRFIIDDYAAIMLGDQWKVSDRTELFTTVTNGDYQMILVPTVEEEQTPVDVLQPVHDAYAGEPANTVTDIQTFATDNGGQVGAYRALLVTDPNGDGAVFYAVAENGRVLQPAVTGPPDLDDPFYDDVDAMIRSVVISAEPRGEQS